MKPPNGKPYRRGLRRAMRGIPTGRHPREVKVTPGRKHERREWDALMHVVFAGRQDKETAA